MLDYNPSNKRLIEIKEPQYKLLFVWFFFLGTYKIQNLEAKMNENLEQIRGLLEASKKALIHAQVKGPLRNRIAIYGQILAKETGQKTLSEATCG